VSPIDTDLRLVEGRGGSLWLEGTVRNGGVALKDALVIVGHHEQRLGDLEPSEEVSVSVPLYATVPAGTYESGLPHRIMGTSNYWDNPELHRRFLFLQSIFNPYAASGGMLPGTSSVLEAGAYLIGWSEEGAPLPVEVVGRAYSTDDTTLYVYALSLQDSASETELTIPSILVKREMVETVGQVDIWPDEGFSFSMAPRSEVTFRFTWSAFTVRRVDELVLEMHGGYASGSDAPTVWLWNRQTSEWDWLEARWGKNRITNVEPYVTSSGSLLVRLESGDRVIEMGSLSISVEGKQ
jgi:hypothetical protein